jgi:hypothetical protein
MQDANGSGQAGSELAILDKGLLAQFAEMVTLIPSEDSSGAERILAQVLSAQSWDALDDPWESSKVEQLAGKILRLDHAERRPSDFREGLGMFLVLHCTDTDSGEGVVVTSSAVSVIGQVTRAYALRALPLYIEFVIAARATTRGYHPHHLKIHGSAATAQAGDREPASA